MPRLYLSDEDDLLFPSEGHSGHRGGDAQDEARGHPPSRSARDIAYAIALIERKVGARLGIKDRAGMEFGASGDPTQEDCVDEATNTTSFLLILQSHGLLKYHTVGIPFSKEALLKATLEGDPVKYWPHWTAVIQETKIGRDMPSIPGSAPMARIRPWSRSRNGIKDINLPKATN